MRQLWTNFFNWLSPEARKNLEDINDRFRAIFGGLLDWWNKTIAPTLPAVWKDITEILKTIAERWLVVIKTEIEGIVFVVDRWLMLSNWIGEAYKNLTKYLPKHPHMQGMCEPPVQRPSSRDAWKYMYPRISNDPKRPWGYVPGVNTAFYGPRIEGATRSDLTQVIGSRDNPLFGTPGGFNRSAALSPYD
jgi:hypothetical protein